MYHSQSVFKFSLRFHYHTSCSYQVHESCSYRLFSLQEFTQNDSKTSCSSSNYCSNFREKQVKKKKKKKKRVCVKPWLKRRKSLEFYETQLAELRLEYEYNYKILLRITSGNFVKLFQLIKSNITKENAKLRELISPRL